MSLGQENTDQAFVGLAGHLYIGAVGASDPGDATSAPDSDWTNLGHVTIEGLTITFGKTTVNIDAWNLFFPFRTLVTARSVEIAFSLLQMTDVSFDLAMEASTTGSAGEYTTVPNAPGTLDERALVGDVVDGSKTRRFYIPKGLITGNVAIPFRKDQAGVLPITFGVLSPPQGADPWTVYNSDDDFAVT
jgi:hypothetical protein